MCLCLYLWLLDIGGDIPRVLQGWDSSLAHWPYFGIWREMQNYMQQHNIPIEKVGTAFPNLAELRYLDLSNNKTKHTSRDLDKNDYFCTLIFTMKSVLKMIVCCMHGI